MFSKSRKKVKRSFFSLIELLIVIGIMGVLTALILPQFSNAEENAKDTGCDYNNAGTLRYVSMFRAANGKYPSGFHTGLDDDGAIYGTGDEEPGIDPTITNITVSTTQAVLTDDDTEGAEKLYLTSMKKAGIAEVAEGDKASADISTIKVAQISGSWFEDSKDGTIGTKDELTFNGKSFTEWESAATSPDGKDGILIPLFAASTVDWDNYYDEDGEVAGESKVGIGLPGKCPWPEDGKLRFYICFFKAFADGSAAKLVGTACPECGPLNAGTF
jgi:type IV pilus assembly protein PilA